MTISKLVFAGGQDCGFTAILPPCYLPGDKSIVILSVAKNLIVFTGQCD